MNAQTQPQSYFEFLDTLRGDVDAIEREKQRLEALTSDITSRIKATFSRNTIAPLLVDLATTDIAIKETHLGNPVSDVTGYTKHLRALAVSIDFDGASQAHAPSLDELFELCKQFWAAIFPREMIDLLALQETDVDKRRRRNIASLLSLVSAFEGERAYSHQADRRVKDLYGPWSADIVEAQLGLSVDQIVAGFKGVREAIRHRRAILRQTTASALGRRRLNLPQP